MKNQLRGTISAYLLAAVVPLGAYAEQEDYFNQSVDKVPLSSPRILKLKRVCGKNLSH